MDIGVKLKHLAFLTYAVISNVQSQTAILSANPDLLYSTANDYGPWGAPEFLNSFTNDFGPVGSPDFLGSVSNDYGVGLKPRDLLLLTPSIITLEELEAPFQVEFLVEP
jgi:hypothetical protein